MAMAGLGKILISLGLLLVLLGVFFCSGASCRGSVICPVISRSSTNVLLSIFRLRPVL